MIPSVLSGQVTGSVAGKVTLRLGGSPLANSTISIIELGRDTHSNANGKYKFINITPGIYNIRAHRHDMTSKPQEVKITAGVTAKLNFELNLSTINEEITITASAKEETSFSSFRTTATLSSIQLSENVAENIGDALSGQAGISKTGSGPGSTLPVIRGLSGERVLILQDGIRTGTLSSTSEHHGEPINPADLERLEVVRGPATLLYGSSALGGVVNAFTDHHQIHKHQHPGFRGRISGVGGSANAQGGLNGEIEYGSGPWITELSGSARRLGNYNTPIGPIKNSSSELTSTSALVGWYKEKRFASLSYGYQDGKYGIPFHRHENEDEDHKVSLNFQRSSVRFTGGLRGLNNFFQSFQLTFNYTDWKQTEEEENVNHTGLINRQFIYKGMLEQRSQGPLSGRLGFWGTKRKLTSTGIEYSIPPAAHDGVALFAYEELDFRNFRLQFGARIEHNAYSPRGLAKRSYTGASYSAGIRMRMNSNTALVASLSNSYRAPSLEELFSYGPHEGSGIFEVGNPDLKQEVGKGVEVSLRHQSHAIQGELNVFHYKINNFIFLAPTEETIGNILAARHLQEDSRFLGGEALVGIRLHSNAQINLGLDSVNAKLVLSNAYLPRIPPLSGRVALMLYHGNFNIKPEVVLASNQEHLYLTETPTAGHAVVNIKASYAIYRPQLNHFFSINAFNLGNRLYRNHLSFIKNIAPEIGRGIRFNYSVRFF